MTPARWSAALDLDRVVGSKPATRGDTRKLRCLVRPHLRDEALNAPGRGEVGRQRSLDLLRPRQVAVPGQRAEGHLDPLLGFTHRRKRASRRGAVHWIALPRRRLENVHLRVELLEP